MNKGLALSLLALSCALISALPAAADNNNPMVDRNNLPLTTFHTAQKRIQIIPSGPIVTNCVRPEQKAPNYVFVGTGQPGQGGPNATINGAAPQLIDGMQIGNPGYMTSNPMVNTGGMEPSRFNSNIPAGGTGLPGRGLPQGTASTRLNGQMFLPRPASTPFAASAPRTFNPATLSHQTPSTAAYQPYPATTATPRSASASAGASAVTSVSARRLLDAHLLKGH